MLKLFIRFTLLACLVNTGLALEEDPTKTEIWEPEPTVVTPGVAGQPPSDAIVLFDGSDLSAWQHLDGSDAKWNVADSIMTVVGGTGNIETRQGFGSVQLHVEWRSPTVIEGEGQGRGNSGVFLQKRYEVQVLDSYDNRTYSNGQAASVYKQTIPLVNAMRPPGEWQTYDIVFRTPQFSEEGALLKPGYLTVLHNGVLVQDHTRLEGLTVYVGAPYYEAHPDREPLMLQDHGNPVSFRNIWLRELTAERSH